MHPPTILLTATLRWPISARLAIVFANMGCRIEVLCPHQHPVTHTHVIWKIHRHSAMRPLLALRLAIQMSAPDLIIPCDDQAAAHLHALHELSRANGFPADENASALIEKSLGRPAACVLAMARGQLMALAAAEGIRTPETMIVTQPDQLSHWFVRHALPMVMKNDFSWGGQGVFITHRLADAQNFFRAMTARPPLLHSIRRWLLDRDLVYLMNLLAPARDSVTLQDFIVGTPANRAIACWQGQVLAGISVVAIETLHPTGPATVVSVIDNAEMAEAVKRLVRKLGISGLWGIDFVLEHISGHAYLIEMNPRATPISHLSLGHGQDLAAAIYIKLTGHLPTTFSVPLEQDTIALFPGEWQRNHASMHLDAMHHDVPWSEPDLVQDGITRPWSERGWLARLSATLRRVPAQDTGSIPSWSQSGPRHSQGRHDQGVCATEQTLSTRAR